MNVLEDALAPVLDDDNVATLAMVSTGENLRESTNYVRSEDVFMARLNYALLDEEPFPIEIHTASDPGWSMYETFKAGLKKPAV